MIYGNQLKMSAEANRYAAEEVSKKHEAQLQTRISSVDEHLSELEGACDELGGVVERMGSRLLPVSQSKSAIFGSSAEAQAEVMLCPVAARIRAARQLVSACAIKLSQSISDLEI